MGECPSHHEYFMRSLKEPILLTSLIILYHNFAFLHPFYGSDPNYNSPFTILFKRDKYLLFFSCMLKLPPINGFLYIKLLDNIQPLSMRAKNMAQSIAKLHIHTRTANKKFLCLAQIRHCQVVFQSS